MKENSTAYDLLSLLFSIYPILAIGLYIWTLIIAYEVSFIAFIVSMFLPVISQLYWMVKLFGVNNLYSWTVVTILILYIPYILTRD
ncbi:hypothetical protein [Gillisia sp. JM1]|uniref:hypothetical protein n=1 Tax=Gillisia sp. JM1 TaxID=1283286 RepID=UPI00047E7AA1|nr:hypothetical protein [Gillisia sp. JM1]